MWPWRRRTDDDFREEIRTNIALDTDRFIAEGMSREAAQRSALRAFGNVTQAQERFYESGRLMWLDDLQRDVRYALRALVKNRGFTVVAVLTLALGIGANTAIFSVVNTVLLTPLPYKDSDRIVRMLGHFPAEESPSRTPLRTGVTLSVAEAQEVQSHARTVTHAGLEGGIILGLNGAEEGARLQGSRVSAAIFRMLDAHPFLGRVFDESDEVPGGETVVLLSHDMWQRYFGGDPQIVGRRLTFNTALGPRRQTTYTVVGVMPPTFLFPDGQTLFWMPYAVTSAGAAPPRGAMVVRLADDVTMQAATAELESLVREIRGHSSRVTYELRRSRDALAAPVKPALVILAVAVSFVLLIACINVANLLLGRTAARHRELTMRAALGAGRGRIVRQVLTESAVLSLAGGIAGSFVAWAGVRVLRVLATTDTRIDLGVGRAFPRLDEIGLDVVTLGFMAVVSLVCGLLCGVAPALRSAEINQMDVLRESASTSYSGFGSFRRNHWRAVLIVAEITMAMVLLVGSGLLIHSFARLMRVDPGYDSANVLTFQISLPVAAYPDARLKTFAEGLVARIQEMPGVQAAGYANQLPMIALRDTAGGLYRTPDPTRKPQPAGPDARVVSQDYLRAMGVTLVAGRGFEGRDGAGQPRVVVINQALARQYFPGENPIGRLVYIGADVVPWEIVGMVDDVRQFALDREPEPQFFADCRQWVASGVLFPVGAYYVVRTTGASASIIASVRSIARALEREAALFNVAPMQQVVASTVTRPRMYAVLFGIFAGIAAVLAAIGIYGVMAYAVAQRTREIGVRMALGARPAAVIKLVLGESAVVTGGGIALGLIGSAAITRYLEGMLFGLTPLDPITFVSVSVAFAAIAMLAAFVPARRATRIDPLVALRSE